MAAGMTDKTYDEINDKFSMEENRSYQVPEFVMENRYYQVSDAPVRHETNSAPEGRKKSPLICSIFFIAASLIVIGAIAACLVFIFKEISKIKSTADSSQVMTSEMLDGLKQAMENNTELIEFRFLQHTQQSLMNSTLFTESMIEALQQQLNQRDFDVQNRNRELRDTLQAQVNETAQNLASNTQQLQSVISEFHRQLIQKDMETDSRVQEIMTRLGFPSLSASYAAPSCAEILRFCPSAPSGFYWVRATNGSAVRVYCDMTRSCGGVSGGWIRVAQVDMSEEGSQCPSPLRRVTREDITTCVIPVGGRDISASVVIPTFHLNYSRVCGKIIGYQYGEPDAFASTIETIEGLYVDGISLTHGHPRQHIWSFAGAYDETGIFSRLTCPCINIDHASSASPPPTFVGNDYFCDTASSGRVAHIFYPGDPLWDGAGCGPRNSCCSLNSPPWFYKQLPGHTTDDIEMRVIRNNYPATENVEIAMVDIYVQ